MTEQDTTKYNNHINAAIAELESAKTATDDELKKSEIENITEKLHTELKQGDE